MRALLGPLLVHGGFVAAGLGVLRVLGVIPSLRSWQALAAGGLAYVVGVAATLGICVIVLVAGGPFTLPVFAIAVAGLAAPLAIDLLGAKREWPRPRARRHRTVADWAALATLAALAVLAVVGLLTLGNRPLGPPDVDAWNQWTRKALLLFQSPHLPAAIFGFSGDQRYGPHYNINASYPLLLPLFEALHLRALGRADPSSVHIALWLLGIAFVWAGGFLAARIAPPTVWVPVLAGAALLSLSRLLSGYADVPLGYYLGLGTLQLGIWLESGRRSDLGVAVLLLAGAAAIKNEGTAGALLAIAAALALTLGRHRTGSARELALAAALLLALAVLPWRLWVAAHHFQTEEPLGRVANPAFLFDHIGRVGPGLQALGRELGQPGGVTLFVAVALALVAVCVAERRTRALGSFYLAVGVGYLGVLVWAYWISTLPLALDVGHSADRLVVVPGFIAVAAVLQLSGPASGPPPSTDPPAPAQ